MLSHTRKGVNRATPRRGPHAVSMRLFGCHVSNHASDDFMSCECECIGAVCPSGHALTYPTALCRVKPVPGLGSGARVQERVPISCPTQRNQPYPPPPGLDRCCFHNEKHKRVYRNPNTLSVSRSSYLMNIKPNRFRVGRRSTSRRHRATRAPSPAPARWMP